MGKAIITLKAQRKTKFRKKKRSEFWHPWNKREAKKIERIAIKTLKAKRSINDRTNSCQRERTSWTRKVYETTGKIRS